VQIAKVITTSFEPAQGAYSTWGCSPLAFKAPTKLNGQLLYIPCFGGLLKRADLGVWRLSYREIARSPPHVRNRIFLSCKYVLKRNNRIKKVAKLVVIKE